MSMHTQRGPTAVVCLTIGAVLAIAALAVPLASDDSKSWITTLVMGPCALFMGWLGLDAWVTRAELEVDDASGLVVLTVRALVAKKTYAFALADVRSVLVDTSDDDAHRLAIETSTERIPLSALATGENLESRAQRIRDFLGKG
jgi:hypothetical protein